MRKIVVVVGILAVVVGIGIGVGWLGSRGAKPTGAANMPEVPPLKESQDIVIPHPAPPVTASVPPAQPVLPPPETNTTLLTAIPATNSNVLTNWEDKLDDILGSDGEDSNKVTQLFAMFPNLPLDGQVEVAQHLSNLVPDDNYGPLGNLATNASLSADVLDVLVNDLLNRPNSEKLPTLLDIARTPGHPEASDAKDLLELYLDDDYGTNWDLWRQKMADWLKANPD